MDDVTRRIDPALPERRPGSCPLYDIDTIHGVDSVAEIVLLRLVGVRITDSWQISVHVRDDHVVRGT